MKKRVDFELMTKEFTERDYERLLNEYKTDLHRMTVRECLFKDAFICPAYVRIMKEMEDFDATNLDYFNYEKELTIGKSN